MKRPVVIALLCLAFAWQGAQGAVGSAADRGYPEGSDPAPRQVIAKQKKKALKQDHTKGGRSHKKKVPQKQRTVPKTWNGTEQTPNPRHTSKQEEMREAFAECIALSTTDDPVEGVKEFVFRKQREREQGGFREFFRALRGSPDHHGQEVCLARAYGLKTFRTTGDIIAAQGRELIRVGSPYVDVVKKEIPSDRQYAREWLRDYIRDLATAVRSDLKKIESRGAEIPHIRITSMIRSAEDQQRLVRQGLTPADCDFAYLCSTHTSGSAVDIGILNATKRELKILEDRLIADQRAKKIFFIRENSHFHIFVLPLEFMNEE